jgi:hypothetical protein
LGRLTIAGGKDLGDRADFNDGASWPTSGPTNATGARCKPAPARD